MDVALLLLRTTTARRAALLFVGLSDTREVLLRLQLLWGAIWWCWEALVTTGAKQLRSRMRRAGGVGYTL